MPNKKFRIITATSGGVDSSIAAALLKKQGHDVVGLFLLMGNNQNPKDAKKIAKKLKIPLKILNVKKEFKKRVIDYFAREYKRGRTPNPCVECNKWIKFKFLFEQLKKFKADYIATGHYTRTAKGKLFKGKDEGKDQSYFLWTLTQKQLKKVLFPIGDYTKGQIRAMAKKWNLPVYEKRESQEICFLGDADLRRFLKARIHAERGPIITTDGEKIGEHEGLTYYTIGQRKGIKIGGIGPFYVVDKDFKKNALIVAQSDFNEALFKKEFTVSKANWISKPSKFPFKCNVKIRYLTPSVPCTIYKIQATKYKIQFSAPQRAITPGQSAVFYSPSVALAKEGKRNQVLGGGIIC
jgi:tRNA-specific 2-thiouridylase